MGSEVNLPRQNQGADGSVSQSGAADFVSQAAESQQHQAARDVSARLYADAYSNPARSQQHDAEKIAVTTLAASNKLSLPPGFGHACNMVEGYLFAKGMPPGWRKPDEENLQPDWFVRSRQLMSVRQRMDHCAQAIDKLNKLGGDFNCTALENLPPGWTVKRDAATNEVSLVPDLPRNWTSNEENDRKLKQMQNWVENSEGYLSRALTQCNKGESAVLRYGDYKFKGEVQVDGQPVPYDIVTYRYQGEREPDGSIKLTINRKYARDHVLNYNNWFTGTVASEQEIRRVGPDELIPVQSPAGEITLVRADKLAGTWNGAWNSFKHDGLKLAMLAVDAGMTVSGGVGLKAAYQAGRKGLMLWHGGRAALGVSGILTPAIEQGYIPQWVGDYRNKAMLGLIALETAGAFSTTAPVVKAGRDALLRLTPKEAATIDGVLKGSKALMAADAAMIGGVAPMVPSMYGESTALYRLWRSQGKLSSQLLNEAKRATRFH